MTETADTTAAALTATERFAEELASERDPERKEILAAIVRLLRHEPLHAPRDARLGTVKALAAEARIDRFHLASAQRGRHHALAQRFLAAAENPDAAPPTERRLRDENKELRQRAANSSAALAEAQRTVELLARANRVLTVENARLAKDLAVNSAPGLRAVPARPAG